MSGDLYITPQALQEMADVLAALQVEQIRMRLDANGNPFPFGVDLIASGALLASIRGVVRNGVPCVEVGVPYASDVNARYNFLGICPQLQPELTRRWQPILERGAALQGEG